MHFGIKDIASNVQTLRAADWSPAPGLTVASRRSGRNGDWLRSDPRRNMGATLLFVMRRTFRRLFSDVRPRELAVSMLAALAIGLLTYGAWTLITWTPLPPQQFAAELMDAPQAQRNAACTRLALSKSRGPYDASMLSYAFDPVSGLCTAVEKDDFRNRVLEARARHRNVASILAVIAMLASLALLCGCGGTELRRPPR